MKMVVGFVHLKENFLQLSDTKIKKGKFVDPEILVPTNEGKEQK